MNIAGLFCDVHDAPQRFTTCQFAKFSGIEHTGLNCAARGHLMTTS